MTHPRRHQKRENGSPTARVIVSNSDIDVPSLSAKTTTLLCRYKNNLENNFFQKKQTTMDKMTKIHRQLYQD